MIRISSLAASLFIISISSNLFGEQPSLTISSKPTPGNQNAMRQAIRVVDPSGNPVADAVLTPTYLISSQGTLMWEDNEDAIKKAELGPQATQTNAEGIASLIYPRYTNVQEGIPTTGLFFNVDHPDFARLEPDYIRLPTEDSTPFELRLDRGTLLELTPTMDNRPSGTDGIYALWSDGRAFDVKWPPQETPNMTLLLPRMKSEKQSVRLAKFDNDKLTHLSVAVNCDLTGQDNASLDVPLKPIKQFKGMLDSSVPRPVINGRVQAMTIPTPNTLSNRVPWRTWSKIQSDGSFTIEAWPQDEPIQVIAICDGYVAQSGNPPAELSRPFDPQRNQFQRPQVFDKDADQIVLAMEPLVKCVIKTMDKEGHPISGLHASSYPNVSWWNLQTQVYCAPFSLWESRNLIKTRAMRDAPADVPNPFEAITNQDGIATLFLPELPREYFVIDSDEYEIPINLGSRQVDLNLKIGETTNFELTMQPKGTEKLGDWESTIGVIFGCTVREGRQICALPEVSAKMDQYREKFRDPKNLKDPQLLAEVFNTIADAFSKADNSDESLKWRLRANEQTAKIPAAGNN